MHTQEKQIKLPAYKQEITLAFQSKETLPTKRQQRIYQTIQEKSEEIKSNIHAFVEKQQEITLEEFKNHYIPELIVISEAENIDNEEWTFYFLNTKDGFSYMLIEINHTTPYWISFQA